MYVHFLGHPGRTDGRVLYVSQRRNVRWEHVHCINVKVDRYGPRYIFINNSGIV